MATPFPGMDPYLERSDVWPDVHNRLIVALAQITWPRASDRATTSASSSAFTNRNLVA